MKQIVIFILFVWVSTLDARRSGATSTSCYNHVITHGTVLQTYDVVNCLTNEQCSNVTLNVRCPTQDNNDCCRCFTSVCETPTLYLNCSYMFSFTPTTNLGFLLQAREINSCQLPDPVLNPSSTIIGTWDSGVDHQQLLCQSSMSSSGGNLPNSVTHNGTYRTDDPNAPSSIDMTWSASTLSPNSNMEKNSTCIAFIYTIARDVSTNFYPFSTSKLVFNLTALPTSEGSTASTFTTPATTATAAGRPLSPSTMLLVLVVVFLWSYLSSDINF